MPELTTIASFIREKGFTCRKCGMCCLDTDGSGLVMVGPKEIRAIMAYTKRTWWDVVEPFPQFLEGPNRSTYTFGWILKHSYGHCKFLEENQCSIYPVRPAICHTYPFMLEKDELRISECSGLGGQMEDSAALIIASDLIHRRAQEQDEEVLVANHYKLLRKYPNRCVVIDSEGVKPIDP